MFIVLASMMKAILSCKHYINLFDYQIGQPISTRYQKTAAKFIKLYPGGFAKYMYPQFQNSQEFALDGGVIFDTLANNNESHADEACISIL